MEVGRFDAQPSEGDLNVRKLFAATGSLVMKAVSYCEVGYQATFVYMLGVISDSARRCTTDPTTSGGSDFALKALV